MKILFTGSIFFLQKYGGISRYFTLLAYNLINLKKEVKIVAPISKNTYLKNLKKNNFSIYFKRFPNNYFLRTINQTIFRFISKKFDPDIIHETYYDENNLKQYKDKIKILTIYDLVHERFSKFYPKEKKKEKKKILKYIDHFICISKNTQKDFCKHYNIPQNKTSVIYLGSDHFSKANKRKNYKKSYEKYFLYIGSRESYKNFKILVDAYYSSKHLQQYKVICFGGGDFSIKEKKKYKLENNFINLQGDDLILRDLYSNATAYINTSKYEGFGIPNVEAMRLGCPVITSNFKALTEIGGDACIYFKNGNYFDLAKKMKKIIWDNNLRNNLIKKGFKRSKKFSWLSCAKQTFKLYKSLLKKKNNLAVN